MESNATWEKSPSEQKRMKVWTRYGFFSLLFWKTFRTMRKFLPLGIKNERNIGQTSISSLTMTPDVVLIIRIDCDSVKDISQLL